MRKLRLFTFALHLSGIGVPFRKKSKVEVGGIPSHISATDAMGLIENTLQIRHSGLGRRPELKSEEFLYKTRQIMRLEISSCEDSTRIIHSTQ